MCDAWFACGEHAEPRLLGDDEEEPPGQVIAHGAVEALDHAPLGGKVPRLRGEPSLPELLLQRPEEGGVLPQPRDAQVRGPQRKVLAQGQELRLAATVGFFATRLPEVVAAEHTDDDVRPQARQQPTHRQQLLVGAVAGDRSVAHIPVRQRRCEPRGHRLGPRHAPTEGLRVAEHEQPPARRRLLPLWAAVASGVHLDLDVELVAAVAFLRERAVAPADLRIEDDVARVRRRRQPRLAQQPVGKFAQNGCCADTDDDGGAAVGEGSRAHEGGRRGRGSARTARGRHTLHRTHGTGPASFLSRAGVSSRGKPLAAARFSPPAQFGHDRDNSRPRRRSHGSVDPVG